MSASRQVWIAPREPLTRARPGGTRRCLSRVCPNGRHGASCWGGSGLTDAAQVLFDGLSLWSSRIGRKCVAAQFRALAHLPVRASPAAGRHLPVHSEIGSNWDQAAESSRRENRNFAPVPYCPIFGADRAVRLSRNVSVVLVFRCQHRRLLKLPHRGTACSPAAKINADCPAMAGTR